MAKKNAGSKPKVNPNVKPKVKPGDEQSPAIVCRDATLRVERVALADLIPHPRNPRVHPAPGTPQWEALTASLAHDYFDPLVVNVRPGPNHMMLVSGHLRHKVLVASGYTHADVSVVDYDEATHLARLLAANHQQGDDLASAVQALVVELEEHHLDTDLTGFALPDLDGLLGRFAVDPLAAPPDLPAGEKSAFTQMTFTLHETQAEVVRAALAKAKADGITASEVNENSNGNALAALSEAYLG